MTDQATNHFDIIVIGAGPAGTAAALRAAELGAKVAVVEGDRTGGTCVNTGCVPTRVLAKAARMMREIRTAGAYGIDVDEHPMDWSTTVGRVQERVDRVRSMKRESERFGDAGIELVMEGRGRFTDAHTVVVESGRRLTADTFIVAVGGHSRRLPVPGAELATVPDEVLSLPELPNRVAIIGAGNTGAQLATVFSSFRSHVTVLDVAPRILMASDALISEHVSRAFVEQGMTLRTGIDTVTRLESAADGSITLLWNEDGCSEAQSFDAVIMATGWPADVGDLGLETAGIEVVKSAVPVDAHFRSVVPHILAVGDANGLDMLVQAAQFEGEVAAENAVLDTFRRTPPSPVASGRIHRPGLCRRRLHRGAGART